MSSGNYTVLARKWRPQRFEDIVGQDSVVRTLANALQQGRVAHAYCFSGIRGVGKTTAARLLAKGLNCRSFEGPTGEPCGHCESCVEIEQSRSLDVIELDAASQTGVDNIRQLTEVTRYAPSRDRHRVFIIDEAHMLSTPAFNALLKTLEEPPAHVVFVLATTEPNKILPTVLSRCQHYQFGRIAQGKIASHLGHIAAAEGVTISADALALLAIAADGSLRDGQSLLDKVIAFSGDEIGEQTVIDLLGLVDRMLLFRATDLIAAQDLPGVLGFVNEMVDLGVDLHQFAIDLLGHFRNLLVVRTVPDSGAILHLPESDLQRLREQAEGFEVDDLDRGFSLLAGSEYRIKTAEQPRYHLEIVMARLARMPRLEPIEQLLSALGVGDGGRGGAPVGGGSSNPRTGSAGPKARRAVPRATSAPEPRPSAPTQQTARVTETPRAARRAPARDSAMQRPAEPEVEPAVVAASPAAPAPSLPPSRESRSPAAELPGAEPAVVVSRLLQRIREHVDEAHPMASSVLGRVSGLSISGERIVFQLPATAGIFIQRLREPEMLQLLGAAAEQVLGRRVIARVEGDPNADGPLLAPAGSDEPAPPAVAAKTPASDERPAPVTPAVAAAPTAPAFEPQRSLGAVSAPVAQPLLTAQESPPPTRRQEPPGDEPSGQPSSQPEPPGLRARVENEPLVQGFVRALRGQITSVEELEER